MQKFLLKGVRFIHIIKYVKTQVFSPKRKRMIRLMERKIVVGVYSDWSEPMAIGNTVNNRYTSPSPLMYVPNGIANAVSIVGKKRQRKLTDTSMANKQHSILAGKINKESLD